jgi:hypothetical protein
MKASELVENAGVPDRFRQIMILYLETYEARVSHVYRTLRHKVIALAHFWRFIRDRHPDVKRCSQILPRHVRDYIPQAIRRAREVQRGPGAGDEVRPTAHSWLIDLRVFFSDICALANEPDSPFKRFAPRTIPATRHTFLGYGFDKARERTRARITATVLDLEREMPKIRAFALQQWKAAVAAPKVATTRGYPWSDEVDTFWDWPLLELLVQRGLRIEEAIELTTFDILKRKMPDSRIYYLLHIKPSKFDRARVIPIGDGLGRVLEEIIRYVICKSSHVINSLHSWRRVKCVFQPQYSCGPPLSRELTREKHEETFRRSDALGGRAPVKISHTRPQHKHIAATGLQSTISAPPTCRANPAAKAMATPEKRPVSGFLNGKP